MWSLLGPLSMLIPAASADETAPAGAAPAELPAPPVAEPAGPPPAPPAGPPPAPPAVPPPATVEVAPASEASAPLPIDALPPDALPPDVMRVMLDASAPGPTLRVGGFADVGLVGTNNLETIDFSVGQLVVHSLATMPGNFSAFTEVSINSTPVWQTRVERLLLSWEAGDALKLSAGRYHIPVTWWNSTFHHGLWLQTTARRPLLIGYNDAFIPAHAVGLTASGRAPFLDGLGIRYDVGINGGADDHKHDGSTTETPRLAWHGVIAVEPRALPKLRVGASSYGDPMRMRDGVMVDERMYGAHLAYTSEAPEVLAEWVVIDHHVMDEGHSEGIAMEHYSYGAYVQIGWRLPFAGQRLKPYVRSERIIVDASDPSLAASVSQQLHNVGVRADLSDTFAMKVEASRRQIEGGAGTFEAITQLSATW